jgi:hypothetical protein
LTALNEVRHRHPIIAKTSAIVDSAGAL